MVGQIVDTEELREAAQSRVEVTQAVLSEFGVEAVGVVMDPDPPLALDDAVRAFDPGEILISCLAETRFGLLRRDIVEWARRRYEVPVVHIPVRIEDDAVRWDVTHTLVVATQTVDSPDLLDRLESRANGAAAVDHVVDQDNGFVFDWRLYLDPGRASVRLVAIIAKGRYIDYRNGWRQAMDRFDVAR